MDHGSCLPFTMVTVSDVIEWVDVFLSSAEDHHDHGLTDIERARNQGSADSLRVVRSMLRELEAASS